MGGLAARLKFLRRLLCLCWRPTARLPYSGDGRVLTRNYAVKPERQMCRLYLSLMHKMGFILDKFGDATAPLEEV